VIALAVITFLAAIVNGALGYGFSSITVPLALLFLDNRVLNPALIVVEVALNAYVLWVNRRAAAEVARRVLPVVLGLVPGVIAGTIIVSRVDPAVLRLATYVVLLPLILLQAGGYRRPIHAEHAFGLVFGVAVGILYSVTTISGPPLAVLLSNQGLVLYQFRAALGLIRLAESSVTGVSYLAARLVTAESIKLAAAIVPSVIVGVPIGAWVIRRVQADTFRRVCMSFDAWVVAFGLATVLRQLNIVDSAVAYVVVLVVGALDAVLLYRFFWAARRVRT
jgi:uncharacterized membrane protein YfcA